MLLRGNCAVETKVALSYIFVPVAFIKDKLIKVIDNKQDPYQEPSCEQPSCQRHASYENYVGYQQEPFNTAQLPSITFICVYIWVGFSPVLRSALLQLSFKTWKNPLDFLSRMMLGVSPYNHRGIWAKTMLSLASSVWLQSLAAAPVDLALPSALVSYSVKRALWCSSRNCLKEDRQPESK